MSISNLSSAVGHEALNDDDDDMIFLTQVYRVHRSWQWQTADIWDNYRI